MAQPLEDPAGASESADASGLAVVGGAAAAGALLDPTRRKVLQALHTTGSSSSIAGALGLSRQLANYHVRALERAGLVQEVGRRARRGLEERLVRATATHYLISPETIGTIGPDASDTTDRFSATYQVAVAARTIREVAQLAALARQAGQRLTTMSLDTEVALATPAAREAFGNELFEAVARVVAKHHTPSATNARSYRVFLGAHPVFRPAETTRPTTGKARRAKPRRTR